MVTTSVPYIAPWSDGSAASLDRSPNFFKISKELLFAQKMLCSDYGLDRIDFREIIKRGFPLPTNLEKSISISINTDIGTYLDSCIELIEREKQRNVLVLDMDGTLYDLIQNDGSPARNYFGSKLRTKVEKKAVDFVSALGNVDGFEAQSIVEEGLQDSVGLSNFISRKFRIPRQVYFESVWDLDPEGLIELGDGIVDEIYRLSGGVFGSDKIKLVLLTSAPKVWMNNILNYLGLDEVFELKYTGEDFSDKIEIFELLAGRYNPRQILSMGDQLQTDIEPALDLGMNAKIVTCASQTASYLRDLAISQN